MQGLVRIITDTRCDVHTFHVDDPCTPVLTVSTPYFQAGQGLMITDMSHWKPSRLKMAGAAKWLDYEKLRVTEHQLLESSKIHTGEEPRCWILVHGLDHFCFTSSISTLNMSLGEELFIDRDRRGSMFLNTQTPKKLLLSVDDSVTQAIQRVYNVMHTFSIIAAGTDPNNSNFELWSGALFELQTRYLHRDQAYGLLPTDPDYVYQCPTFRSPTCPTEQPSVPETPENPSVVDRYQQALLDRELYGYQLKIQSYKQLSETIQIEIKDVKKDAEQVHQLNQDFQVQYLPFEEEQQQHQQHHHHQHHHQHHHHLHPHPTQPQPLPPQHFHQEVSSEVFDPSMNITKLQAQKAKQNSSLKIIKNVFHAVRRKH
ncbi:hypothetical protein HMI55_002218 [Coelomomyces lativittatus]|nr:hypothetical protein HMI55_002218 [Coelomomyces lativittatus]